MDLKKRKNKTINPIFHIDKRNQKLKFEILDVNDKQTI